MLEDYVEERYICVTDKNDNSPVLCYSNENGVLQQWSVHWFINFMNIQQDITLKYLLAKMLRIKHKLLSSKADLSSVP